MSPHQGRALQILHAGSNERIAPRTLISLAKLGMIRRSKLLGWRYRLTRLGRIHLDLWRVSDRAARIKRARDQGLEAIK